MVSLGVVEYGVDWWWSDVSDRRWVEMYDFGPLPTDMYLPDRQPNYFQASHSD